MTKRRWRYFDFALLGATLLLIVMGVAMIRSAIVDSPGLQDLPTRQVIYAGAGLVLMVLITLVDYRGLLDIYHLLYLVCLGLLGAVLMFGTASHGAQRWVDLQLFPIQPAEVAKLLLIIVLAGFFARRQTEVRSFRTFLVSLVYVIPPVVLIFLEPSLSAALSVLVIWFALALVAGVRGRYLLGLIGVGLATTPFFWMVMADYQRTRLIQFLMPERLAPDQFSNVQQALISIGSGGWLGKGFALGSQSQLRFLRVRWSDFIFAVIGEELGMVGILVLFALLLVVILRLFRTAENARDLFGQLIATGVGVLVLFQAVVNIGMNLGVVPATGVPLPFVSSGGSSLVTFLVAEGLVQSISIRRQKIEFHAASRF